MTTSRPAMPSSNHFVRSVGLVRNVASAFAGGNRDVFLDQELVAKVWDTDLDRPTALFIDMGHLSEQRSHAVMDALQGEYGGRLRWVANPTKWSVQ